MTTGRRVIVYIDGFNLYHGLTNKGWRKYLWLDLWKFSNAIVPGGYNLIKVRYFTSRIKGFGDDPDKPKRQALYLDALATLFPKVVIEYGNYQAFPSHCRHCDSKPVLCANCGNIHVKPNEKKTDVNIATFLLVDAFENNCDAQILISGDSDYETPVSELRRLFPDNELFVAFPPKRKNNRLSKHFTDVISIPSETYEEAQFPYVVVTNKGIGLHKPDTWQ
jgi:hypothetical protein